MRSKEVVSHRTICDPDIAGPARPFGHDDRKHSRAWLPILLFSVALLIPCFWQTRIQAADLSSHIYNAWLASRIEQGALPGLWISSQSDNVLFDLILQRLMSRFGPGPAQRIAVSASVLVFGWGAIFFVFAVAGRNWWIAGPSVAMFAHGFIFHMGFFNFYLSLGLCLWYLAIFWNREWHIRILAAPLVMLAWLAHPLPVVWAAGTAIYVALTEKTLPSRRLWILALGTTAIIAARYVLLHSYRCSWSVNQAAFITGANQLALFGTKYLLPLILVLLIWAFLLRDLLHRVGASQFISRIPFQLWLLNAAAIFLLPTQVFFPTFARPFGFIAERMSLSAAMLTCCLVVQAPTTRLAKAVMLSAAVLFFGLLYQDDLELSHLEDRLDAVVAQIPPAQRVITPLFSQSLRSLCFLHDLDRACIGHCFSYANYEPSSRQFRIRARAGNGIVLNEASDVDSITYGGYKVQPRDVPLNMVYLCGKNFLDVCWRPLAVGDVVGN